MTMISPYQQMQRWRAAQGRMNDYIMGSPTDVAAPKDFSADFANASAGRYIGQANLAARAALNRIQQKSASQSAGTTDQTGATDKTGATTTSSSRTGGLTETPGAAAAKTAGAGILASLGMDASSVANSFKTSSNSSSQPYKPPTDPATGKAYVARSAAALSNLGTVNFVI
jgi:hypothetical protein